MTTKTSGKFENTELKFTCPECGGKEILEHLVNYENIWVDEDGEMEIGDMEWWESDKVEYSCLDCFWKIVDEDGCAIRDEKSLIRWLRKEPKSESVSTCGSDYEDEASYEEEDFRSDYLRFTCPKCGDKQLDSVNHTATVLGIYEDGSIEYFKTYGGDIEHFRCHACRWIVENEKYGQIDDPEILASWLIENCDQD